MFEIEMKFINSFVHLFSAEHGIFYLFVRTRLNWDMVKFGLFTSYSIILHSFGEYILLLYSFKLSIIQRITVHMCSPICYRFLYSRLLWPREKKIKAANHIFFCYIDTHRFKTAKFMNNFQMFYICVVLFFSHIFKLIIYNHLSDDAMLILL